MDNILEVKNLKVAFRTQSGTVKAVRDISFNVERGKTLAIVGESGSGKSVTSKAILGILAGNSILEGGEILYDGRDLLKITEEEMCTIRGNRISMIFQDPLSSLDPIVKIGRQITEAMLLKNKGNRKTARKEFNSELALLKENMIKAAGQDQAAKMTEMTKTFDSFNAEGIKIKNSFNTATAEADELISKAEDFLFLASKKQKLDVKGYLNIFTDRLKGAHDPFLTKGHDDEVTAIEQELKNLKRGAKNTKEGEEVSSDIIDAVNRMDALIKRLKENAVQPEFFSLGYYKIKNPKADLTEKPMEEMNKEAHQILHEEFFDEFEQAEIEGVKYSFNEALEKKKTALESLKEARTFFETEDFTRATAEAKVKESAKLVEDSIDKLEVKKDSMAYTYRSAMMDAINRYFTAEKKNPKEEARYERQNSKREAKIARGKSVDWKVLPPLVYDLDELRENILKPVNHMIEHYEQVIEDAPNMDYKARVDEINDYFEDRASQVVAKITKSMAKEKAISLMEEVGIPEPRIRYNQYPFEFSGGMRQRIVIAIALAADPDILICDEPTTALDVTIQAQILELINKLKAERNLSVIFITHDLGVVANMADDIAVMYAGKIVEYGTAEDVFYDPRHPYTWALLASMPDLDTNERLEAIPGTPPNMIYPPKGDAFAARNKYAMEIDFEEQPPAFQVSETHWAATWLLHPDAPKADPPKIIVDRIERMKKVGGEEA